MSAIEVTGMRDGYQVKLSGASLDKMLAFCMENNITPLKTGSAGGGHSYNNAPPKPPLTDDELIALHAAGSATTYPDGGGRGYKIRCSKCGTYINDDEPRRVAFKETPEKKYSYFYHIRCYDSIVSAPPPDIQHDDADYGADDEEDPPF